MLREMVDLNKNFQELYSMIINKTYFKRQIPYRIFFKDVYVFCYIPLKERCQKGMEIIVITVRILDN